MRRLYDCLGIEHLGLCAYNPAQPNVIYFSVGDAVAALGFTLAIQQLIKPTLMFRLRAYGLKLLYINIVVFAGAACSIIALLMANVGVSHNTFWTYPVFWELVGGLLISLSYAVATTLFLKPARINSLNLVAFVRAAAALLSSATDEDRTSFAHDLFGGRNIETLISFASAWKVAEGHAASVEFDRLRSIGAPLEIRGRPLISPFYLFAHRCELERATFSGTFLGLLSDTDFCSALVRKSPWLTASMLDKIADRELYAEQAESFVQEIAYQAILNEDSLFAKEVGYIGFRAVPLLSRSIFRNHFILRNYNPLGRIGFDVPDTPSVGFIVRLNSAVDMMLETAIEKQDFWPPYYMHNAAHALKNLYRNHGYQKDAQWSADSVVALSLGLQKIYMRMTAALSKIPIRYEQQLFVSDRRAHRNDLVEIVASLIFESLSIVANGFRGFEDPNWHHAIDVMENLYPEYEHTPTGMDPLQQ